MPREPSPAADVRKLAVLRANGLGDLVFSIPAFDALRARFPTAEIVLLAREWHAELLTERPSPIDRVEVIPAPALPETRPSERAESADADAFFERMRDERFDVALQLHGGGRNSNPFTRALGARLTVGMRTPDAAPLDRWIPYVYYQAEIARYLEVVGLLGAPPVTLEPSLAVTPRDVEASEHVVEPAGRPLAVLHPGATDARRRWPAASFASVGDHLHDVGARVVVTGTRAEADILDEVRASMREAPDVACGSLELSGLLGLLSRAGVVVSNDTGPLHLAAALGTPTVGIYWCGNLINGGPLTVGRRRHATSWRLECPTCGVDCTRGRCDHTSSFVADVTVAEVVSILDEVLERHPLFQTHPVTTPPRPRRAAPAARRRRAPGASSEPLGGTRPTASLRTRRTGP